MNGYDQLGDTLDALKIAGAARDHFYETVLRQHHEIAALNKTVEMLRKEINRWYDKYPIDDEEEEDRS